MQSVLRIADRFYEPNDWESVEHQSRLQSCLVLVFVFHMMLVIAFVWLQEWDAHHPRVIRDADVAFEIVPPPPEPRVELPVVPALPAPVPGRIPERPSGVGLPLQSSLQEAAAPPGPTGTARERSNPEYVRPLASHRVPVLPPVAVTSANEIKQRPADVAPAARSPNHLLPAVAVLPSEPAAPGAATSRQGEGDQTADSGGNGRNLAGDPAGGSLNISTVMSGPAAGNISPYRRDMLLRIARNWHPKGAIRSVTVLAILDKDGKLVSAEIVQRSGSGRFDRAALAAVEATEFAPLPDWYKGKSITFQLELNSTQVMP